MLYLEDYLEMIEHLPQELKDRFTEIRQLDLQVSNETDKLNSESKNFFQDAKKYKASERDVKYESIRKSYYKALEDADEKVHQATQMHDLVDRYLRRLDQELHKFKMELEADNAGITETLEKRSLELDHPRERDRERDSSTSSQKENRLVPMPSGTKDKKNGERKGSVDKFPTCSQMSSNSSNSSKDSYNNLNQLGGGGTAIIAIASAQAIAATQQMQQGRRTASLKASYDAINLGLHGGEFFVGGRDLLANAELHAAAQQALAATAGTSSNVEQKRNKRKSTHGSIDGGPSNVPEVVETKETPLETEWFADPNEPRYCLCNNVSYGDMVACDNETCPIEWYHYGCVGITSTPKGKWYCPQCAQSIKRRGRR